MKVGELAYVISGEYDDFAVNGHVRALKDFDDLAVTMRYRNKTPHRKRGGHAFIEFLCDNGYAETIKVEEFWVR